MPFFYAYIYKRPGDDTDFYVYAFSRKHADRRMKRWFPDCDTEERFLRRELW